MLEALGWVATAVFSASYFFRKQNELRLIQAVAACLWITYGLAIGARPVVVANMIVAAAAVYTSLLKREWTPAMALAVSGQEEQARSVRASSSSASSGVTGRIP